MTDKLKKGSVKIGKNHKIGLPGSDSYNAKTPRVLKAISEGLVLIGSLIGVFAIPLSLTPLVVAIGSGSIIVGRWGLKCVSKK